MPPRKHEPQPTPAWTMPTWMEPYRELIVSTGGNDIESMMSGAADPIVLSTLPACVQSQVLLLIRLHDKLALVPPAAAEEHPLDDALGNISEAALALEFNRRHASPELGLVLANIAGSLADAHERIEHYLLGQPLEGLLL